MHPGIASPASGLVLPRSAPFFAYRDGVWNNSEGFRSGATPDEDSGAWFKPDDGTGVEIDDVHVDAPVPWSNFSWSSKYYAGGAGQPMLRLVGHLRPADIALPSTHPKYGPLGQTYVDQGAFEIFIPHDPPSTGQKIAICIMTWQTRPFMRDWQGRSLQLRQLDTGFYSPDGLMRDEALPTGGTLNDPQHTAQDFLGNTSSDIYVPDPLGGPGSGVYRPTQLELLPSWDSNSPYWPILAYPSMPVMHRQPTLNEQRYLQLVKAIKLMLQETAPLNPLVKHQRPPLATTTEVDERCVVVFVGNSNGGLAAEFAALRHPGIVHGAFAQVIHPCYQRLYSGHDMVDLVGWLTGTRPGAGGLSIDDFLLWGQYTWAQGLEMSDMSYMRLFLQGRTNRPAFFAIGDEDVTSTGVDWAAILSPTGFWLDHGISPAPVTQSYVSHEVGFAVAENGCHQTSVVPIVNPYNTSAGLTYSSVQVAHSLIEAACDQRDDELSGETTPALTPLQVNPRNSETRGLDEPHEWAIARLGEPLPPANIGGILERDDAFFSTANPDSCGVMPGRREAMLIKSGRVYVGSADGLVSVFEVDEAHPKQPLRRVGQSARLGHSATALAVLAEGSGWSLLVGTRRHVHKLDPTSSSLAVQATSAIIPWECSKPHHMTVADVLPGHAGSEIIFASEHGGLIFYDTNLNPLYEWSEPGIRDFVVQGATVTFVSLRGVIASVTFDMGNQPTLVAVSAPLPPSSAFNNPDVASQGLPGDMELMMFDFNSIQLGSPVGVVSAWRHDIDGYDGQGAGVAIRAHDLATLSRAPWPFNNKAGASDLATCRQSNGYMGGSPDVGDHLLVLGGTLLRLIDQFGTEIGRKDLTTTQQGYWPFGLGAHAMCVGELVNNSGTYEQEIVVATNTGLMWLHVDDLIGTGSTELPAAAPVGQGSGTGYWIDTGLSGSGDPTTHPRTNSTRAATWAVGRRPDAGAASGLDDKIHMIDQHGAYWRVAYDGTTELWERERKAKGTRAMGFVGSVTGPSSPAFSHPAAGGHLGVETFSAGSLIATSPFAPVDSIEIVHQNAPMPVQGTWVRSTRERVELDGFLAFSHPGVVVDGPQGTREAWMWSDSDVGFGWGNLLEGMQFDLQSATAPELSGSWVSGEAPASTALVEVGLDYLSLRSQTIDNPSMSQQSIYAARMPGGTHETVLLVGCPGGRLRAVAPGEWRTSNTSPHGMGTVVTSTDDLGFGGSALAVRDESTPGAHLFRIWFGTLVHPTPRPAMYATGGELLDDEVATSAIHTMTFGDSNGQLEFSAVQTTVLSPSAAEPRGAYGIVGMRVADLLPASTGDELIVATLAGDVIVFNIAPVSHALTEVVRTQVPGSTGCYNAILVEDLNGDGNPELYVGGSLGLWRFVLPDEQQGV